MAVSQDAETVGLRQCVTCAASDVIGVGRNKTHRHFIRPIIMQPRVADQTILQLHAVAAPPPNIT